MSTARISIRPSRLFGWWARLDGCTTSGGLEFDYIPTRSYWRRTRARAVEAAERKHVKINTSSWRAL